MKPDRGFRVRFEGSAPTSTPGERLIATCELHDVALEQLKARLRREQPTITDAEVHEAVRAWLAEAEPHWGTPRPLSSIRNELEGELKTRAVHDESTEVQKVETK